MAKKKEKKPITLEERLLKEKETGWNHIQMQIPFINTPTYFFTIGDKVQYGALKECIVDDIMLDGKIYGLRCIATNNNYRKPYDYETYRICSWTEVRPLEMGDTQFSTNDDIRLNFHNSTIESIIRNHYYFGIDFTPDYQRDYVWEDSDKELLLDSIFKNIDIGKFVLIVLDNKQHSETGFTYEILDGKQRLLTLIEFYENRFSYKGKFYNDLSWLDRYRFKNHHIAVAEVDAIDKKTVLKYFFMLNRTGKVMDSKHLQAVEKMLEEE